MAQPVLIFDGDCGFCTTTANFIVRRSKLEIVAHAWQLVDVKRFGITEAQAKERVYVIRDGQAFGGHEAFAELLKLQSNWFLSAAAWLMLAWPIRYLSRLAYKLIARYRHKLPGGTPACKLPSN